MMGIIQIIEELEHLDKHRLTKDAHEALNEAIGIIEDWAVDHPDEK